MTDYRDIVTDALIEIGELAPGDVATADQADHAARAGNRMIDQWQAEDLTLYATTRTTFTITANDNSYTIGSGADINVARPVAIESVGLIDTNQTPDTEWPLHKLLEDEYARVPQKAQTNVYPDSFYYNPTFPNGTLLLLPVPTGSGLEGAVYARSAISEFAALSTSVSLPPGYRELLVTNLAVKLADMYGRTVSQNLALRAMEAKATVKRANQRPVELRHEAAAQIGATPYFNVYTGE